MSKSSDASSAQSQGSERTIDVSEREQDSILRSGVCVRMERVTRAASVQSREHAGSWVAG